MSLESEALRRLRHTHGEEAVPYDADTAKKLADLRKQVRELETCPSDIACFLRNRRNADGSITLTPAEVTRLVGILGHAL